MFKWLSKNTASPYIALLTEQCALCIALSNVSGTDADFTCRVRNIVGKSCVKVWATKVITIFQHYEDQVVKKIDERCKELGHLIEGIFIISV